ncbi:MAG: hypothetical protein Q4E88_02310 [Coriobacteriia bacterium]|nr:hypothetical protein [Coriobacteriia bacterium]
MFHSTQELIDWINSMPPWLIKASEMFFNKTDISEKELNDLTSLAIHPDKKLLFNINNNINYDSQDTKFYFRKLSNVEGVNAVKSETPLEFNNNNMCVIYGDNGTGKSSYFRIFKTISSTEFTEQTIIGNIYEEEYEPPSVEIFVEDVDNNENKYACDLNGECKEYPAMFSNISVFDSDISNVYVDRSKRTTYIPYILRYFENLVQIAENIKNRIVIQEQQLNIEDICFPDELKQTESYRKYTNISRTTAISEFKSNWSDNDKKKLKDLENTINEDFLKQQISLLKSQIKNINILESYLIQFQFYFAEKNWNIFAEFLIDYKEACAEKDLAMKLFKEESDDIDRINVNNTNWVKLWEYAKSYFDNVNEKNDKSLGEINTICPLCNQKIIKPEISTRMIRINEYVNGCASENVIECSENISQHYIDFPVIKTDEDFNSLLELTGFKETEKLQKLNKKLNTFQSYLSIKEWDKLSRVNFIEDICDELSKYKNFLKEKYNLLVENLEDDNNKKIFDSIKELRAKKILVDNYSIIEKKIKKLQILYELDIAKNSLSTVKISRKAKEVSAKVLSEEYINNFDDELKKLTNNRIKVRLEQCSAKKSKIPFKIVLQGIKRDNVKTRDILSDGERKIVSLAAFFAESSLGNNQAPMILDDPISSLDYNYEKTFIDRLVEKAANRQIILFTHRISLVVCLKEKIEKAGLNFNEISLSVVPNRTGVPDTTSSFTSRVPQKIKRIKNELLPRLKKATDNCSYQAIYNNITKDFRIAIEKSVEDILLNEVVVRFRKDVKTKNKIDKLASITNAECKLIDYLMTKYSEPEHSHPDDAPLIFVDAEELEEDLEKFNVWVNKRICENKK